MSAWRRKALALFPHLRRDLHDRSFSYYMLFFDLLPLVRQAHAAHDTVTLRAIYDFAAWCLQQEHRADDLYNAVCVAFYEHLFDHTEDWESVSAWLTPTVAAAVWPLWKVRLGTDQWHALRTLLRSRGIVLPT